MSISLQDALGVQPAQAPKAKPPAGGGSFSLQDGLGVVGGKPPVLGQQSQQPGLWDHFQTAVSRMGSDYWQTFRADEAAAHAQIKSGYDDMFGPVDDTKLPGSRELGGVGKSLLGIVSGMWAPIGAAVTEAASKPAAAVVNKVGSMVPTSERGGNWDISKQDVQRNTAALNEFLDTAFQTYAGLKAFPITQTPDALGMLTPEARAEFKARPAREAKKVETAFDILAVRAPEQATEFANSVNKIDPKLSKTLHKKVQKWIDASEAELNKLGEEHAKQQLESMDGKMPTDYTKLGLEGYQGSSGEKFTAEKLKPFQPQPAQPPVKRDALGTPLNVEATTKVQFTKAAEAAARGTSDSLDSYWESVNWEHEQSLADAHMIALEEPKKSWKTASDAELDEMFPTSGQSTEATGTKVFTIKDLYPDDHPNTKPTTKPESTPPPKETPASVGWGGPYKGGTIDSRGKPVHPTPEGQAAFQKWFKGSTVVDEKGQPLILYHGTKNDINSFSNAKNADHGGRPFISLSTSPRFASEWKQGQGVNVLPVYARAKNVADFRNPDHVEKMAQWLKANGPSEYKKYDLETLQVGLKAAKWNYWEHPEGWKALGFDGAWVREHGNGPLNFVTLKDKGNIKSAYGNRGTFSGSNPLLVYSGVDVPRLFNFARQSKLGAMLEGKLKQYYDYMIRNINPEALGLEAKKSAAILAKGVADLARDDSMYVHRSMDRKLWWEKNRGIATQFINRFERGDKFADNPALAKVAEGYRRWNDQILARDRSLGIDYEPQDHYLPHIYENPKGVQEFYFQKFGPSWTTPGFAKTRSYELYEAAEQAGFKRKFSNPEDIMLARQHASDVAEMKVQALEDLEKQGLAVKKTKGGVPPGPNYTSQPSPNGGSYWVHNDAYQVLHNAFNTTSLWTLEGPVGDAFRGAMALKNSLIPIKLGLSLFHPLHVATIHNATAMVRSSKELLAGTKNPAQWLMDMGKAAVYKGFLDDPRSGHRILRAFQGKIADTALTAADKVAVKMMAEGGFIPEMSSQYRTKAIDNFRMAIARGSPTAAWHAPWAALQLLQKPIFEHWIPSLKIASYLQDVKTALKTNPALLTNDMERGLALRKLAKSVDNRYGEMAYNTLFWNRWVKDIATANTLSLGWQLGFVREYGGGMLDVGQVVRADGSLAAKAATGKLDRPLFVTFYTAQAMAYGGLMTWAMTGKSPAELLDYIYPKTGEKNKDGSDARVGTMFYTKEFAATAKHIETEGLAGGLAGLAASKASGLIGLTKEAFTGVNSWGDQIRRQGDPVLNQIGQTITNMAPELNTISLEAIRGLPGQSMMDKIAKNPGKAAMTVAGFNKAPKYITQSKTDAAIDQLYKKEYAPKETSFDKAEYSKEARELRKMYEESDDRFDDKLSEIEDKFQLTPLEARKLRTKVQKDSDPQISKFKGFTWPEQKQLLDKMTPDEREKFLKHSNKQHLRYKYEPPADEQTSDSGARGAA